MGNRKQPEVRFEGFEGEWEERKLLEIAYRINKSSNSEILPKVEFEDITAGEGRLNKDISQKLDNRKGIEFESSDILYGKLRPYLKNWLLTDFKGVALGDFWVLRKRDSCATFIYILIQSDKYQKVANETSGTKMPRSDWEKVSNTKFFIPQKIEQQKIGTFFKQLDDRIALCQRQLELLKEQKKGFLQKMFPKAGEKTPEVRFAGFTEEWEEKKLRDFTKRVQGNDGRMDLPTLTISAGNGWMDQRDRFSGNIAGKEQKNYTLLRKGQLSYNHGNSKLAKYGAVFELENHDEALVPRVYHSFEVTNGNAKFIDYLFKTKLPDRELRKLVSSGARMDGLLNISYKDFSNIQILLCSKDEQQKIGTFFKQLDNVIVLNQKELDVLKETKKGFLQKMFL